MVYFATKTSYSSVEFVQMNLQAHSWHGTCNLRLKNRSGLDDLHKSFTIHQGSCTAPLKLMRSFHNDDGRCHLPIIHTAGGLVGGDKLTMNVTVEKNNTALLTNVAAQKVYGSVGRSKFNPDGKLTEQNSHFSIHENGDLEWLPQELVLFNGGLFEQTMRVDLASGSSFLSAEVVRLGRTAAGEKLGSGYWRSGVEICRHLPEGNCWEFVDQLELSGEALRSNHGIANQPVFGSFIWAAPNRLSQKTQTELLKNTRRQRQGLEGTMTCSALDQGLSARYIGPSTQAARFWFIRIWALTRALRGLSPPEHLRLWPMQENPFAKKKSNPNHRYKTHLAPDFD